MKLDWDAEPAVGDLDGDGDEDVLVGIDNGEIKYFRNEEDSFTELKGNDNPLKGVNVGWGVAPTILDVDSDGDEDLLVGNDENLKYFRNDSGTFTEQKGSINPFKGMNLGSDATPSLIDLNGDGDEDVLVGNDDGKIKYLENLTTNVNDDPIAKNDSVGILDNNPVTINVLKNDFEPEKELISLMEFEGDTERGGTVELDDKGTPEDLSDDELIYIL